MHELTAMIRADLEPALGGTEPGAVAFCAALVKIPFAGRPCETWAGLPARE